MIAESPAATIRRGEARDAEPLAAFAARIFRETFTAGNRPEDVEAHIASHFGPEIQRRELDDPASTYLIAEQQGTIAAYALLGRGPYTPPVVGGTAMEIARFYVDGAWHGTGLARQLMDRCVAEAQRAGAAVLWLGVWEHNPRAIRFYEKVGFHDVGSHHFQLGSDPQTDRLMVRPVIGP
jgi:diamine N-acetyltransferase